MTPWKVYPSQTGEADGQTLPLPSCAGDEVRGLIEGNQEEVLKVIPWEAKGHVLRLTGQTYVFETQYGPLAPYERPGAQGTFLRAGRGQVRGGWGGEWALMGHGLCPCPSPQGSHLGFNPPAAAPEKRLLVFLNKVLTDKWGVSLREQRAQTRSGVGGSPDPQTQESGPGNSVKCTQGDMTQGSPRLAPPITGEAAGTWILAPCPGWGLCGRVHGGSRGSRGLWGGSQGPAGGCVQRGELHADRRDVYLVPPAPWWCRRPRWTLWPERWSVCPLLAPG